MRLGKTERVVQMVKEWMVQHPGQRAVIYVSTVEAKKRLAQVVFEADVDAEVRCIDEKE